MYKLLYSLFNTSPPNWNEISMINKGIKNYTTIRALKRISSAIVQGLLESGLQSLKGSRLKKLSYKVL